MNRVLITGGTGSFGRAMTRCLIESTDVHVAILSRGEYAQAVMRSDFGATDQERLHWMVGDVRDQQRLTRAMKGCDVVIHAAALKRVEVGELNPTEMVKTNILGTMNVIEAAIDAGVNRVVYLSSDKACQPLNAYGATKLAAEKLILAANNARGRNGPTFVATRYGNVAGSTGSVIPTWRALMKAGKGGIYITDPEATRFWMTLQQAVNLVYAAATEPGPDIKRPLVPDLPAYCLYELALAMDVPRPIEVKGMGQGEKMHERMKEDGPDSSQVRRMTVGELREALKNV